MAGKRRRDVATPDTRLIEIYEDLANESEEIRLTAAHTLLSDFAQPARTSRQKIEAILQRLFRGLCSSRKAARLGFSIALTEFLAQIFQYPAEETGLVHSQILSILENQTLAEGSTSGQDERDHYFGRLFGAEAIVKSCIFFKPKPSLQLWRDLLHLICRLALKKQWLRQECGWLLFTSISYLRSSDAGQEFATAIVDSMNANRFIRTPEGVAVWLEVRSCYPEALLPQSVWKHRDPLRVSEVNSLAEVMKDARAKQQPSTEESTAPQGAAAWSQQLHFCWDVVLRELYLTVEKNVKVSTKRITFARFWDTVVDKSLFLPNSSPERKHWGLLLLAKVVATAPSELLKDLFTTNTVSVLINHLKLDERYLHRSATKAIQALQSRASRDPGIVADAIQGLVFGSSGLYNFDSMTKTKTVTKLLTLADLSTFQIIVPTIRNAIERPEAPDERQADVRRRGFADMLVSIFTRTITMANEDAAAQNSVAEMVLDSLVGIAYSRKALRADGVAFEPPPSSECVAYLRSRIRTCLDQGLQNPVTKSNLLRYTVYRLKDLQQQAAHDAIVEFDAETRVIVETAWKRLGKISKTASRAKVESPETKSGGVLEMLYSLAILQLHEGDADAVGILHDLNNYHHSLREGPANGGDTAQSDAIVEIVLSFASKPSRFSHQIGLQAFRAYAGEISRPGLHSLIRVLETRESSVGIQNILDVEEISDDRLEVNHDVEQNGGSSGSSASDSAALDSDVEEVSSEGTPSWEESERASTDDEAELGDFDAKLAAALGTRRGQDDLGAEDSEGSDEDMYEEDMDEEEMKALDEKLAEVFRARKPATSKKQERRDTKEAIVNFKRRVLDLIDVYLRQEHLNPLALDLVVPLITSARTSSTKQISDRAHDVLQGFCSRCKGGNVSMIDGSSTTTDQVLGYLQAVHKEAGLDGSRAHTSACSKASILLVKVLVKAQVDVGKMVDVYAETRKRQLSDSKCKVQPMLFTEWNNWCTSARDQLAR